MQPVRNTPLQVLCGLSWELSTLNPNPLYNPNSSFHFLFHYPNTSPIYPLYPSTGTLPRARLVYFRVHYRIPIMITIMPTVDILTILLLLLQKTPDSWSDGYHPHNETHGGPGNLASTLTLELTAFWEFEVLQGFSTVGKRHLA